MGADFIQNLGDSSNSHCMGVYENRRPLKWTPKE